MVTLMSAGRQPMYLTVVCSLAIGTLSVKADTLTVAVLDESNKGVPSRVILTDGTAPSLLGETDQRGTLRRDHTCENRHVLKARPMDIGSYFESAEQPCNRKVTLKVVSRQTPKGKAFTYRSLMIRLPDGSDGVIVYRGVLETWTRQSDAGGNACDVTVRTVVRQAAFRIDGENWLPVQEGEVQPSAVFEQASVPAQAEQSVLFPFKCEQAIPRIQALQSSNATSMEQLFATAAISSAEALRALELLPAPQFAGGTTEAKPVVTLSPEQRTRIKRYVVTQGGQPARASVNVSVGATIPQALELDYLPGEMSKYRYAVVNDRPVIVDPNTKRVLQVID
jgi:hypothetical protein